MQENIISTSVSKKSKIDVLIVGAFKHKKNGATGGVLFASKSLTESRLKERINWIKLDSTGSVPPPNIFIRSLFAIKRIFIFLFYLIIKPNIKYVLLFSSDGGSFIEKGLMCLIAKAWRKIVLFAPRSGVVLLSFENELFRKFGKHILNKADWVVCQGNLWKEYYYNLCNQKLDANKFISIPNWIDSITYEKKVNFGNQGKKVVFLFLGWVIKEKGVFDIIEAVNSLTKNEINLKVIIGGDGADRKEAERVVDKLELNNFISFLGWVQGDTKKDLLQNSDVFILPSYFEGFPNSVLEAMASGLPVIVTDVGAVSELVDDSNCVIVPIGDTLKIAEAMSMYIANSDLRKTHGANGYNKVRNNFDVEAAISKFEKIFE